MNPTTPAHPSLLPALSPSAPEPTPAPLHMHNAMQPHQMMPQPHYLMPMQGMPPPSGVFGVVMGSAPGQLPPHSPGIGAKVYASVYSGIPVFEAMVRGISVMRRTSDSWVNATQILKVAGIPKSGRTKILEKEVLTGMHEKVQGGYGKYQGTWIPFHRGQELAAQYGVTQYLSPIFDFVSSANNTLPLRDDPRSIQPPYEMMMPTHPSAMAYPPNMYYPPPPPANPYDGMKMTPSKSGGLEPAPDIGLPPSEVYVDQYGQVPFEPEQPEEPEVEKDESDDDLPNDPLPSSMRLSNKPTRPRPNTARIRSKILSLFTADEPDLTLLAEGDDVDMVIDNQGHTALHWACALAKLPVINQLIELGADIHRGNYAGETPLIRSVLTTNHFESGTFQELLARLSPSLRTLDHAHRTVVHHVALIAGVKGRAASARSYMASILEWVAKDQEGVNLKLLVDVQDVHGDTALNVAARVGNRGLIKLLLDAGADKARGNKLGLKPQDFGVEVEALKVSPAEAVVSNLKSEVPKPERQSKDVLKNISSIFETINETFSKEMTEKQTKLNATEASVRHATRALSEKRQHVQRAQSALGELEQLTQKTENVRRALGTLPSQDWTGRSPLSAEMSGEATTPVTFRPTNSGATGNTSMPERGQPGSLVQLRRISMWEDRAMAVLEDRMRALEGESADKAVKYRRLVSLCTKVPVDKVDGSLDVLTAAIESDGQSIDLGRISGFMARMQKG